MKCQKCNKNEANTHYTQIINGKKTEYFLCSECAAKSEEIGSFNLNFDNEFDNFLSGFFGGSSLPKQEFIGSAPTVCDCCKMTFNEFLKGGRLGCSECYDTFASRLLKPLKQIHGSHQHTGKVPERMGGELKKTRKIEKLENELSQAVSEQNFEKAAELRDKIRDLRKEA